MVSKNRSFIVLLVLFRYMPSDILYYISKFTGKYITYPKPELLTFSTKLRKQKYHTKHLVVKTRWRAYSI